jgi:acetyl esterase/lipase
MSRTVFFLLFLGSAFSCLSQDFSLKVWPDGPPNTNKLDRPEEQFEGRRVRYVSEAEIYVYLPEQEINTRTAVLICPGGGYWIEAMDHEGYAIAEWLESMGIAGIVLKYRLPYGHDSVPSSDARQAMRIIRQHAGEWQIDPGKVGIAGSSAGGHLASTVGTRFDTGSINASNPLNRFSCRPDFMLLLYPVISFREDIGHMGSRINLIGETNNWEHARPYANELHVTADTPPAFFVLADNDRSVDPRNSVNFYLAMKDFQIPAEMHIFQEGGHGFGLQRNHLPVDQWPDLFYNWLKAIKIIDP